LTSTPNQLTFYHYWRALFDQPKKKQLEYLVKAGKGNKKMVEIKPMDKGCVLWRCLHGGPLSMETMEQWPADQHDNWKRLRARNVPLIKKLISTYGNCAMVAQDGDEIIGMLRFYPKAMTPTNEKGLICFCMQQFHPAGAADDFVEQDWPSFEEIEDKTLVVHCVMASRPFADEKATRLCGGNCLGRQEAGARKGIGSKLAKAMVEWAKENGWKKIEVTTHPDLDIFYGITGNAGKTFWEKAGFRVTAVRPMSKKLWPDENARALIHSQAKKAGIISDEAWSFYDMECVL